MIILAENISGMRPQKGATTITLPVTFDYNGGRKDSGKYRTIWAVIVGIVGALLGFGTIFSREGNFILNIFLGLGILFLVSLIIRFVILREGKVRRNYLTLEKEDYKVADKNIWGIYDISPVYPYYCRFRNGKSGLFVRLNKDVILGKYSDSEYEHYEAIGDALNIAGASKVRVCHVDYMDNVGTDERIEESFIHLSEVDNPDVKDILTDIFSYLQNQMMMRVTTFDVYAFIWSGSDIGAWNTIQRILSCFMEANYRSYHILNSADLRELSRILFNLNDFSVLSAMSTAFDVDEEYSGVVPIKKIFADGTEEIYNKTMEERRLDREQAMKEQELKKQELKNRKNRNKSSGRGKSKGEDEMDKEFDLFEK